MLSSLNHIQRIFRIAWVLSRFDALFLLKEARIVPLIVILASLGRKPLRKKRRGQRLAAALQNLGPSFIKFGQAIIFNPFVIHGNIPFESNYARIACNVRFQSSKLPLLHLIPFTTTPSIFVLKVSAYKGEQKKHIKHKNSKSFLNISSKYYLISILPVILKLHIIVLDFFDLL